MNSPHVITIAAGQPDAVKKIGVPAWLVEPARLKRLGTAVGVWIWLKGLQTDTAGTVNYGHPLSVGWLAHQLRSSDNTVRGQLQRLCEDGLLTYERTRDGLKIRLTASDDGIVDEAVEKETAPQKTEGQNHSFSKGPPGGVQKTGGQNRNFLEGRKVEGGSLSAGGDARGKTKNKNMFVSKNKQTKHSGLNQEGQRPQEEGMALLADEIDGILPGAGRRVARVAIDKARAVDGQMWVTPRELAVLVHLVDPPAEMLNPAGLYVSAIVGLVGTLEHRLVQDLEAGRVDADETFRMGRTKKLRKAAAVWLDLCGSNRVAGVVGEVDRG